jgi:predicted Zn-dependent peptidase
MQKEGGLMTKFHPVRTSHGLQAFVNQTDQFKTTVIQLFIDRPFDDQYSLFALLPHVLKRGSWRYPDSLALARHFDELYGASFGVNTHRLGERHVLELQLELADQDLLPAAPDLLALGLQALADLLLHPRVESDAFAEPYVEQEKEAQIRAIRSLYNDKAAYAEHRCLQEMFRGEPFSRLALGDEGQIAAISPAELYRFYQGVLQEAGFHLYISGNTTPEQVAYLLGKTFDQDLGTSTQVAIPGQLPSERPVRSFTEEQDVAQGKLVLAYRSGIGRHDEMLPALAVCNGILGGFGHSKLFQHLREQASLAYDCSSDLVSSKGVLLIEAGIAPEALTATREIVDQQIEAMQTGDWTEEEWNKTLLALQNGLRSLKDRPTRLAQSHVDRVVNGVRTSDEQLLQAICSVTTGQVQTVAGRLQLDTVYFLQGAEGEEENE